jgi:hypothetical protein
MRSSHSFRSAQPHSVFQRRPTSSNEPDDASRAAARSASSGRRRSSYGLPGLAWLVRALGREAQLNALLAEGPDVPWTHAARAVASGDSLGAASILADVGSRPDEAYARLRAAHELAAAGRKGEAEACLDAALAFYESVSAITFLREGEALRARLAESATSRDSTASAG